MPYHSRCGASLTPCVAAKYSVGVARDRHNQAKMSSTFSDAAQILYIYASQFCVFPLEFRPVPTAKHHHDFVHRPPCIVPLYNCTSDSPTIAFFVFTSTVGFIVQINVQQACTALNNRSHNRFTIWEISTSWRIWLGWAVVCQPA